MAYPINLTNGTLYTTVLDGTVDITTGLNLIGRNYIGYGDAQNENFIKLLENFADSIPPTQSSSGNGTALTGTLWYNTSNRTLQVYNGTNFVPVSGRTVANAAPTLSVSTGDQWYNPITQQLSTWNGSNWDVVGPAYSSAQGKTGAFAETLTDTSSQAHSVVSEYTNGQLVSIVSADSFDLSAPYYGFTQIASGINSANAAVISETFAVGGTTELGDDTTVLGQLYLAWANNGVAEPGPALLPSVTNTYDIGSATARMRDIYLTRNLSFGFANVAYDGTNLVLLNTAYQGNVDVYVNGSAGNVRALHINGNTGQLTVSSDPIYSNGVATKNYVDNSNLNINTALTNQFNDLNGEINQLRADYTSNLATSITSTNSNLTTATTTINANIAVLTANVGAYELATNANIGDKTNRVQSLENLIQYKSNIASPAFTGTPTVPDVTALTNYLNSIGGSLAFSGIGDSSQTIADTNYVDSTANLLYGDYNSKITNEVAARTAAIANALLIKANLASPAFTGTVTAPTVALGDNSQTVATTAYVTGKIAQQQFRYTVSTNPPSGGNPGDFWFQIG